MSTKIQKLLADNGFNDATEMAEAHICSSTVPAICTNPECDATYFMEADQNKGYCENCNRNTVKSLFILMGII
jgi:hypothetical protein